MYRYEQSGELHGLTRVRGFTQDDAHMFVRPDQLLEEFEKVIDIVLYIFKTLKFDNYTAQISLRDPNNKEKYIGSDPETGEKGQSAIIQAAKEKGLNTVIEYGEAAFYGPKLISWSAMPSAAEWQLGTIQVDYNLPERFDLTYKGRRRQDAPPDHDPPGAVRLDGAFRSRAAGAHGRQIPAVASPDQVVVLPISEKFNDYAEEGQRLPEQIRHPLAGGRPQREDRPQDPRQRAQAHPPYLLIVGERRKPKDWYQFVRRAKATKGQMTLEAFRDYKDRSGQPRDRRQQNGAKS